MNSQTVNGEAINDQTEAKSRQSPVLAAGRGSHWHEARVFIEWCLRREAPKWRPTIYRVALLLPIVGAGVLAASSWPFLRGQGIGRVAMQQLLWLTAVAVFIGGQSFASRAVCWEASPEMRNLVRLTGLDPKLLLWSTTLSRWWTIAWSLLLLLPLGLFAFTLGGVTSSQLFAGACGVLLWAALVGGFGMLAGGLTVDAKNAEKTAAAATWGLLVFYNMSFLLLGQAIHWGSWLVTGDVSPQLHLLSQRIIQAGPGTSLTQALNSPGLFSPNDPGYWLHFLTAICCSLLATVAIELRFRSDADAVNSETADGRSPSPGPKVKAALAADAHTVPNEIVPAVMALATAGRRPRCSDRPFFWKDVYVLSDEGKRPNWWTVFYCAATLGSLFLGIVSADSSDRVRILVMAILSVVAVSVILPLRFDALLTSEFRDRTWGSLMLLPVDPLHLLRTKLEAVLWEQRFAVLPVGVALVALVLVGPREAIAITGMVCVIGPLVAGLLCQFSCITQLTSKVWWVGPCQAVGFVAALAASICLWLIPVSIWDGRAFGIGLGFAVTVVFLAGVVWMVQHACVNRLARDWVEM